MRRSVAIISILAIISGIWFQFLPQNAQGITFTWDQTSWSGGGTANVATYTSDRTGWDEYSSKDANLSVANGGSDLKLGSDGSVSVVQTTDADFNTGTYTTNTKTSSNSVTLTSPSAYLEKTDNWNGTKYNTESSGDGGSIQLSNPGDATYDTGSAPYGVAFDSHTNSIWISNCNANTVSKMNVSTGAKTDYAAGSTPVGIVFDPVSNSIWVANDKSTGTVSKIDVETGEKATISTITYPRKLAYNPITQSIWVINNTSTVGVISVSAGNGSTGTTLTGIGTNNLGIAYDSATESMWVGSSTANTVSKVDAATGVAENTYGVAPDVFSLAFDPVTNSIWAAGISSPSYVSKVNVNDGTRVDYSISSNGTGGTTFDSATNSIWVTDYVFATKFNVNDGTKADYYVPTGTPSQALVFESVTNSVWVTEPSYDKIVKISASSDPYTTGTYVDRLDAGYSRNYAWDGKSVSIGLVANNGTVAFKFKTSSDGTNPPSFDSGTCNGSVTASNYLTVNISSSCSSTSHRYLWYQITITRQYNPPSVGNLYIYGGAATGTYTSSVIDTLKQSDFNTFSFSATLPSYTNITMDARAGNTATPDGTWTDWQTDVSSGGSIASLNGNRYIQYQARLATTSSSYNPTLDSVTINYQIYTTATQTLTSSVYNSTLSENRLSKIEWSETLLADTDIKFQLRTSPDNSSWTEWQGPSGTSSYFTDPAGGESMPGIFASGNNDQYFQYKVFMSSTDQNKTPILSDVSVSYSPLLSEANSIISVSSPTAAETPITITVTSYDINGDLYTNGGNTVVITVSGDNPETPSVTDNGDGTYTATYTPTTEGSDQITATINGNAVGKDADGTSDGTYNLTISEALPAVNAANSIVSTADDSITAGSSMEITVTAYDQYNNPFTSGGSTVVVTISGSNSATPAVTDNGDGTYTATYTPTTVGADQITATINGTAVGKDADGTSDGTYNLTVSAVPEEDDDDDEDENENHSTLTKSKDGTLTLDTYITKGKKEVVHISPEDDQATQIKEIEIEADDKHKIDGEIEIKKIKKTEIPELPQELSGYLCSVYTQIKIDADASIEREDVEKIIIQFRISKKYRESHPFFNFYAVQKKSDKITLLKTKNNKANEITAISSNLEGTWTILDCASKSYQKTETEEESSSSQSFAPEPNLDADFIPSSENSTPQESTGLRSIQSDVDGDGNLEEAIDAGGDLSDGYETFSDPDGSSVTVLTLDGDADGLTDFILDTNNDSSPEIYWDPDSRIFSRIQVADVDGDSEEEYVFGAETYYDPSDKKVKFIRLSLRDRAKQILDEHRIEAASIVAVGAALPLATLPFQLNSLSEMWLLLKESLLRILGLLGLGKKKRRDWGIVYDVDSGFPLPLAKIQVIDNISGKIKETRLTDSLGSYCFLVSPGTYVLNSEKKEFSEFKDGDLSALPAYYENTYHYNPLEYKDYGKIDINIPMQTISANTTEKFQKKSFWKYLIGFIFWLGFLVNLAIFAIEPNIINGLIVLVYLLLKVMRNFGNNGSKWGTVTNTEGVPQSFVTLKLYKEENRELVARTITDEKGRYFLIANPGNYILTAETIGGKHTEISFSSKSRSSVKDKIEV